MSEAPRYDPLITEIMLTDKEAETLQLAEVLEPLFEQGLSDLEIAERRGVSDRTVRTWKRKIHDARKSYARWERRIREAIDRAQEHPTITISRYCEDPQTFKALRLKLVDQPWATNEKLFDYFVYFGARITGTLVVEAGRIRHTGNPFVHFRSPGLARSAIEASIARQAMKDAPDVRVHRVKLNELGLNWLLKPGDGLRPIHQHVMKAAGLEELDSESCQPFNKRGEPTPERNFAIVVVVFRPEEGLEDPREMMREAIDACTVGMSIIKYGLFYFGDSAVRIFKAQCWEKLNTFTEERLRQAESLGDPEDREEYCFLTAGGPIRRPRAKPLGGMGPIVALIVALVGVTLGLVINKYVEHREPGKALIANVEYNDITSNM